MHDLKILPASLTITTIVIVIIIVVVVMLFYFCYLLLLLLLASERSERDTYRGNTIENRGCLFICIYVWTYVCHFVL